MSTIWINSGLFLSELYNFLSSGSLEMEWAIWSHMLVLRLMQVVNWTTKLCLDFLTLQQISKKKENKSDLKILV